MVRFQHLLLPALLAAVAHSTSSSFVAATDVGYEENGFVMAYGYGSDDSSGKSKNQTIFGGTNKTEIIDVKSKNQTSAGQNNGGNCEVSICRAGTGESYEEAKIKHPDAAEAIKMIESEGLVTWYNDNRPQDVVVKALKRMVTTCKETERIAIAVYGIPAKDCNAGFSDMGRNKNMDDYKAFIKDLTDNIGTRKVLYVLEPDAIGLLPKNGCGVKKEYMKYLKFAVNELSKNPNAQIYLDVGYWIVQWNGAEAAEFIKQIWPPSGSQVRGIVLNTSNYRPTKEMVDLCTKFSKDLGREVKCVIDTSRNALGAPGTEWCNAKNTGIGQPPSMPTGYDNVPYYLWVKPPGESDGECTGHNATASMIGGPKAGHFFKDHFKQLWNNGYFVKQKGAAPMKC